MNLEQLESFIKIKQEGSFNKAAELLYIPQPTLSNRIRQLEQELGVSLFVRNRKRVQTTAAGERFYHFAEQTLEHYSYLKKELRQLEASFTNNVKIGFPIAFYSEIISEFIPLIVDTFSEVKFSFHQIPANEVFNALKNNQIDVGVTPYLLSDSKIEYQVINHQEIMAILSPEHPLAKKEMVTIEEVCCEPVIVFKAGTLYQDSLIQLFDKLNLKYKVFAELGNLDAIKLLVKKNLGITLLPNLFVHQEMRKKELVSIPVLSSPFSPYITYLAYQKNQWQESSLMPLLIEKFVAYFNDKHCQSAKSGTNSTMAR